MLAGRKGYDISIAAGKNTVLTVRAWGLWDAEDTMLAGNFTRELREQVENIEKDGEAWCVCEDFAWFYPKSRDVCRILGDGLVFAIHHGMKNVLHCENAYNTHQQTSSSK